MIKFCCRLILLTLALWQGAAFAQDIDPVAAEENQPLPEEIRVTASNPQAVIDRAQLRVYDLFNDLNDDDDYDIYCFYDEETGTRIKQRVCRSTYTQDVTASFGRDTLSQWQGVGARVPLEPTVLVKEHTRLLVIKMEELARDNADFRAAMFELIGLRIAQQDK